MLKDNMFYRNYVGSVYFNDKERIFYGQIEFTHSPTGYKAKDIKELRYAFKKAVDDYINECKDTAKELLDEYSAMHEEQNII